jgi:preprotein translocase subunit SecE
MAGIGKYMEESYDELVHKVTWPSWKELQESSVLVFIASLIIAGLVFLMDFVFGVQNSGDDGSWWKGIIGFIYEFIT